MSLSPTMSSEDEQLFTEARNYVLKNAVDYLPGDAKEPQGPCGFTYANLAASTSRYLVSESTKHMVKQWVIYSLLFAAATTIAFYMNPWSMILCIPGLAAVSATLTRPVTEQEVRVSYLASLFRAFLQHQEFYGEQQTDKCMNWIEQHVLDIEECEAIQFLVKSSTMDYRSKWQRVQEHVLASCMLPKYDVYRMYYAVIDKYTSKKFDDKDCWDCVNRDFRNEVVPSMKSLHSSYVQNYLRPFYECAHTNMLAVMEYIQARRIATAEAAAAAAAEAAKVDTASSWN